MLAVVKKPHTKTTLFEIKGDVPDKIIDYLKREYEVECHEEDDDEEFVNLADTEWYQKMENSMKPGDALRIYRDNYGYSQSELGKLLGGLSRQKISDMENNRRSIGKEVAKKLSKIFNKPVEYFI